MRAKILIVEDDNILSQQLKKVLVKNNYDVDTAFNSIDFFRVYDNFEPDVILLDIFLEDSPLDGLEILENLYDREEKKPKIIVLSAMSEREQIERVNNFNIFNYVEKGVNFKLHHLLLSVENAVRLKIQEEKAYKLQLENRSLKSKYDPNAYFVGECDAIKKLRDDIKRYARADEDVILVGETGTGKEVAAKYYSRYSPRHGKSFEVLNSSAIPDTLIESELFGYEKGAFTGADTKKEGMFERANGGILFLDEVAILNPLVQTKLLRAIEYRNIQVIGGGEKEVDTRLVMATNDDLHDLVNTGKFRKDLFYRIEANVLTLPPLRERGSDIILLMNTFFETHSPKYSSHVVDNPMDILPELLTFSWDGNIRELFNFCKHIMIREKTITNEVILDYLNKKKENYRKYPANSVNQYFHETKFKKALGQFETDFIKNILRKTNGNVVKAAELMELDYSTLYKKLRRLGINLKG
ncbi:MAG: sigma-54 dependent transcriptional regulator [Candidatus Zophobacter franzmannii]|nr:sigma-54 dependent transcriptional regulator [Candidatus Zophobacter franzmannii]